MLNSIGSEYGTQCSLNLYKDVIEPSPIYKGSIGVGVIALSVCLTLNGGKNFIRYVIKTVIAIAKEEERDQLFKRLLFTLFSVMELTVGLTLCTGITSYIYTLLTQQISND